MLALALLMFAAAPLAAQQVLSDPGVDASELDYGAVPQAPVLPPPQPRDPASSTDPSAPSPFMTPKIPAIDTAMNGPATPPQTTPVVPRDPFAPAGIGAGAFLFFPMLETDAVFTDNLSQTDTGRTSAFGLRLAPSLRLESRWIRHSLKLNAGGEFIAYNDPGHEKDASANAGAVLRLDIRRATFFTLETTYDLGEEDTSGAGAKRIEHDIALKTGITHDIGRLRLNATGEASWTLYGNTDLSGRRIVGAYDDDYVSPALVLRGSYAISPAIRPYVEGGADTRIYDRNRDASGSKRNSKGFYIEAGVELAPDSLWSGRLGLRYALRDYDDPSLAVAQGIGLNGELTWRPSRITSVQFKTTFDIDETTSGGANGARKYGFSIAPRHALRDNLLLKGEISLEYSDYLGVSDHELQLNAGGEIVWIFHRGLELVGAYDLERMWSTFAGSDYLENRITLGLRFRM